MTIPEHSSRGGGKTSSVDVLRTSRAGVWLARAVLDAVSKQLFDEITIKGLDNLPKPDGRGLIIVGNHPSNAAVLPLVVALAKNAQQMPDDDARAQRIPHMLAKSELFPLLLGVIMRLIGQIPVERSAGVDALRQAALILKQGGLIGIYPEGTRTKNPDGWPTPVTMEEQLADKLAGLKPDSRRYQETLDKIEGYGYDGHYQPGMTWLAQKTGALIVPTLTYVDDAGGKPNIMIEFSEPITAPANSSKQASERRKAESLFTARIMLIIAEMMANAKGEQLPDKICEGIWLG